MDKAQASWTELILKMFIRPDIRLNLIQIIILTKWDVISIRWLSYAESLLWNFRVLRCKYRQIHFLCSENHKCLHKNIFPLIITLFVILFVKFLFQAIASLINRLCWTIMEAHRVKGFEYLYQAMLNLSQKATNIFAYPAFLYI